METEKDIGNQLRIALSPREGQEDEKVASAYSAHIAKIHENAKEHYHDPDYPKVDIPIRQLYFALGDGIIGTNRVFNDIDGKCQSQIIIQPCYYLLMLTFVLLFFVCRSKNR